MQKFIKFGVFSGGGWLLDAGLLLLLTLSFGLPLSNANFVSSSIAALSVYTASRFLVFNSSEKRPIFRTFLYFCYTCGIIIAASAVIGPVAWSLQRSADFFNLALTAGQLSFLAKVGITPPQLIANFFMSRYLAEY